MNDTGCGEQISRYEDVLGGKNKEEINLCVGVTCMRQVVDKRGGKFRMETHREEIEGESYGEEKCQSCWCQLSGSDQSVFVHFIAEIMKCLLGLSPTKTKYNGFLIL